MADKKQHTPPASMPSVERVQQELASAQSLDDRLSARRHFCSLVS
jgi:hypothetical protein